jgi:ribosome biogenesis protein MAK21
MIGRMMKEKPGLKTMINFIANDEEEKFEDVPEEDTLETVANSSNKPQNTFDSKYDPRKRDPSFANADSTYLWELMPFVNHFHPTVSLYARSLLKDAQIEMPENASNYDPLINHTLSKFLDRFVYKNPKKMQNEYKGSSLMQPRIQQLQEQPLNLLDWSKKNEMNVPVEEVSLFYNCKIFFMKYFQANPKKAKDTSKQEDQVWDDLENPSDHSADEGDFGLDDGADIDEDLSFYDDALPDQELADSDDTELESMDEEISAENLEVSDSDASVKNKESPRKKRKTGSLASKAKSLGYKGSFFNDALSEFAPIEDFEAFL